MSWKYFDDDCPGCRPALLDIKTRRAFPTNSPQMQAVLKVWAGTSKAERVAFHNVTCKNSRYREDLKLMQNLMGRIQSALGVLAATNPN